MSNPLYNVEIAGTRGRFGVSATIERNLAIRALEKELTSQDFLELQKRAKEIYLAHEVFKPGAFIPRGAFSFYSIGNKTDADFSWLAQSFNYLNTDTATSFGCMPRDTQFLLVNVPQEYAFDFRWDLSHNIDSEKQAKVLRDLFLVWARSLIEIIK